MTRGIERPRTFILSRSDVAALMERGDYLQAVETGMRAAAEGRASAPPPMAIEAVDGSFHAKGAGLRLGRHYVALKFNGNFPANPDLRGLPTVQGAILLCDGVTGSVLAILDSIEVTLRRTAAATALAARFLARPDSEAILVCGAGEQGRAQLEALGEVLPLRRCLIWDRDRQKAERLVNSAHIAADVADDLASAAAASDVIVACTTSRSAYLQPEFVRPGTFVAAVGADSPEKSEVQPELMRKATVVVDVVAQCAEFGDLHHALRAGAMREQDVHAELHELLTGTKTGRTADDQIILFDSTGTALQDVASAAMIYERASSRAGLPSINLAAAA